MKTSVVSSYSRQLTRFGFVNCYLIQETDGLTLVDTCVGGSAEDILAAASSLGASIRHIVLTHAHVDHVGSVDALMDRLGAGRVELISNARGLPLLEKPPNTSLWTGEPQDKIKGGLPGITSRPTRLVTEDDWIGSLRTVETPGHIPGHLSFLDERDGTLYAGDALVGKGRLTVSGFAPWYFPLPNFATWSAAIAVDSARKLLTYPIERLACGHGRVQEGGRAALSAAIARTSS